MADGSQASPTARALALAWRKTSFRLGLAILGLVWLAAIYAPFLATESAWVWWDGAGLQLPVLASLFDRNTYPKAHDLLFNLLALALPVFAGYCWFARSVRWSRRLGRCAIAFAILAAVVTVPWRSAGDGWKSLWEGRPPSPYTSVADHAAPQAAGFRLLAPIPHRWDATYPGAVLQRPGWTNPATGAPCLLGTDPAGHDVAARMLFGARISLTIGLVATGLSLLIGTIIGAISGYFGGWTDLALQRLVEIMMCFPTFILILTVVAMTSRDIFVIMIVLGLTGWAGSARLVRGEFLAQAARDYVRAAEALGLGRRRIMFRHILPNAMAPLLIAATFGIAGAVSSESGLSFLGLGDPNAASWGQLLNHGRENITFAWLIFVPGLAVFILVSSLNLVGNGLREAFDPKAH
jgi:peptide/nickel transport system permease protein